MSQPNVPRGRAHLILCTRIEQDPNECKAGEVDLADKSVFLGVTLIIKLSKPNVPRGRAYLNLCTRIEQDPNECKA